MIDQKNIERIYFFNHKGSSGPEFETEAETLEYINNVLLEGIESRDPKDNRVAGYLNGETLILIETNRETNKKVVHQWGEASIARFPKDGWLRKDFAM